MCLKKYHVTLTSAEKAGLKSLVTAGKAGGMRIRNAMMLSALDESDGNMRLSEEELASAFSISSHTLHNLRKRFVEEGFDAALHGHPRTSSPTPPKMTGELEARLIATACSNAPQGYGQWSLRLLGSRIVELGYCESISHETVRQVLKKTILNLGEGNII
jgi:transposase